MTETAGPRRFLAGRPNYHWRGDAALAGITLIWGATFVVVKQALDDISTLLFLTLRFSLATAVLAVIMSRKIRKEAGTGQGIATPLRGGILAGICLFCGYVFQTFGLKYTTAAKAGFITGFHIPLVPLAGALLYRRFPAAGEVAGVAVAFVGTALLTWQGGLFSIGRGDALVMCCAVAYAFQVVVLGHFAAKGKVAVLATAQIGTCAMLGAAMFWWAETPRVRWSGQVWLALLLTSLLATALAFAVQTWAQQFMSATRAAIIFSLEPLFAWLTSYIVLGDRFGLRGICGAILILAGIITSELRTSFLESAHNHCSASPRKTA